MPPLTHTGALFSTPMLLGKEPSRAPQPPSQTKRHSVPRCRGDLHRMMDCGTGCLTTEHTALAAILPEPPNTAPS